MDVLYAGVSLAIQKEPLSIRKEAGHTVNSTRKTKKPLLGRLPLPLEGVYCLVHNPIQLPGTLHIHPQHPASMIPSCPSAHIPTPNALFQVSIKPNPTTSLQDTTHVSPLLKEPYTQTQTHRHKDICAHTCVHKHTQTAHTPDCLNEVVSIPTLRHLQNSFNFWVKEI